MNLRVHGKDKAMCCDKVGSGITRVTCDNSNLNYYYEFKLL